MKGLIPILVIFVIFFTGCKTKNPLTVDLDNAESLLDAHPDSALELLRPIILDTIQNPDQRAHYALIKSRALDEMYMDLSDTLIAIASGYYSAKPYGIENLQVLFLKARMAEDRNDLEAATELYIEAEGLARKLNSHYWLGRIYRRISTIFSSFFNGQEALEFALRSKQEFEVAHDSVYPPHAALNLAIAYAGIGEHETSLRMMDSLIKVLSPSDSLLRKHALSLKATQQYVLSKDSDALATYALIYDDKDSLFLNNDKYILACLYMNENMEEQAERLVENAVVSDDDKLSFPAELFYQKGEYKKAYDMLYNLVDSMNTLILTQQKQSVSRSLLLNRQNELEKINYEYKIHRLRSFLFILVFCMILIGGCCFYYFSNKAHRLQEIALNTEIDNYISQVSSLIEDARIKEYKINELITQKNLAQQKSVERFNTVSLQTKYVIIDGLLNSFFSHSGQKNEQRKILEEIEKAITQLRKDGEELDKIEAYINQHYNNVFKDLRANPGALTEDDFNLIIYLSIGFSTSTICLLRGEKPEVIYNRKARLKKRIKALDPMVSSVILGIIG